MRWMICLRGIAAVGELTPRTNDLVVSFGERLSSRMIAEAFDASRVARRCMWMRGSCIVTDAQLWQGGAAGAAIEEKPEGASCCRIWRKAAAGDGRLYRIDGEGITTTLGRGGSDYTAALVGGGIACRCD